ncbi:hypothetical protein OP10G_1945 [Fimbriimonas ginsengisoli Gsoil 348]|uniref:Uncharacterized protein n=1 Tax=Fimbriimonas ginsengisoli Gsoil 348 TaxID=661478 RepID=A0A068NP23_FIMGI|nr:hypothetical protein OP10G_1945 [Fimbriimonas ginsengisoli Gsoil 348]
MATAAAPGIEAIVPTAGGYYALRRAEEQRSLWLGDARGNLVFWDKSPDNSTLLGADRDGQPVLASAKSVLSPRQRKQPILVPWVEGKTRGVQHGVFVSGGVGSITLQWSEVRGPAWTRDRPRQLILDAPYDRRISSVGVSPSLKRVAVSASGSAASLLLFDLQVGSPPTAEVPLHWSDGGMLPKDAQINGLTLMDDRFALALIGTSDSSTAGELSRLSLSRISLYTGEVEPLGEFLVSNPSHAIAPLADGTFALLAVEQRELSPKPFVTVDTRRVVYVMQLAKP